MKLLFTLVLSCLISSASSSCQHTRISFSRIAGCPNNSTSQLPAAPSSFITQCSLLCALTKRCAAAGLTLDGASCELSSAEQVWLSWNSFCHQRHALVNQERLDAFRDEFVAARNVTQRRLFIPGNSVKVLNSWMLPAAVANISFIACVDSCTRHVTCRGVLFHADNCSLLTDYPLCRWFQQPPDLSHVVIDNFHSVGIEGQKHRCFETVTLRLSSAVNFDRLWSDYKAGFGEYHGEYFAGMQWLHERTAEDPMSLHQLRVDLLYWNDSYIFAKYSSFRVLDESTNFTVRFVPDQNGSTANAGCLAISSDTPFMTRDRGLSFCAGSMSNICAVNYQPHWHGCCHRSGPFGKFYDYPQALNTPERAKGIVWSRDAPKNMTDGFYYSFKQLEMLLLI